MKTADRQYSAKTNCGWLIWSMIEADVAKTLRSQSSKEVWDRKMKTKKLYTLFALLVTLLFSFRFNEIFKVHVVVLKTTIEIPSTTASMFRQNLSCGKQRKTRNEETLTRFFNDG